MDPRANWDLKMETSEALNKVGELTLKAMRGINSQKNVSAKLTNEVNSMLFNLYNLRSSLLEIYDVTVAKQEKRNEDTYDSTISAAAANVLYYINQLNSTSPELNKFIQDNVLLPGSLRSYVEGLYAEDSGRTPNRSWAPESNPVVSDLQSHCIELMIALQGQLVTLHSDLDASEDKSVRNNKNKKIDLVEAAIKNVNDVLYVPHQSDEKSMVDSVRTLCEQLQEHVTDAKKIPHVGLGNRVKSMFSSETQSKTTTLLEAFVKETNTGLEKLGVQQESKQEVAHKR
jgi:hypothetical protein